MAEHTAVAPAWAAAMPCRWAMGRSAPGQEVMGMGKEEEPRVTIHPQG
jgi:hypothetical protein